MLELGVISTVLQRGDCRARVGGSHTAGCPEQVGSAAKAFRAAWQGIQLVIGISEREFSKFRNFKHRKKCFIIFLIENVDRQANANSPTENSGER